MWRFASGFISAKPNELRQRERGGGKGEWGGGGVCRADSWTARDAETGPVLCNAGVEWVMERRGCADRASFYRAFLWCLAAVCSFLGLFLVWKPLLHIDSPEPQGRDFWLTAPASRERRLLWGFPG